MKVNLASASSPLDHTLRSLAASLAGSDLIAQVMPPLSPLQQEPTSSPSLLDLAQSEHRHLVGSAGFRPLLDTILDAPHEECRRLWDATVDGAEEELAARLPDTTAVIDIEDSDKDSMDVSGSVHREEEDQSTGDPVLDDFERFLTEGTVAPTASTDFPSSSAADMDFSASFGALDVQDKVDEGPLYDTPALKQPEEPVQQTEDPAFAAILARCRAGYGLTLSVRAFTRVLRYTRLIVASQETRSCWIQLIIDDDASRYLDRKIKRDMLHERRSDYDNFFTLVKNNLLMVLKAPGKCGSESSQPAC